MSFLEKFQKARDAKNSLLCVGLDPVSIFLQDTDAVPRKYFEKSGEAEGMHQFCLDVIEATQEFACAYKLNAQFALPFNMLQMQSIASAINKAGAVSIFDNKLSDIDSSNASAIFWMNRAEFDAFTFSPFAGNVAETIRDAHKFGMGTFALALMSNPGANIFMKESTVGGLRGFEWIVEECKKHQADGLVVGATNPLELVNAVKERASPQTVYLVPGVGRQHGEAAATLRALGDNTLINVGRDIIYHEDMAKKAKQYRAQFNEILGRD